MNKDKFFEEKLNDYIAGTLSAEEKTAFFSLIQESEEYRRKYEQAARLRALLHIPALEEEKEESYRKFSRRMRAAREKRAVSFAIGWRWMSVAAVVLAVLVSAVSIFLYKRTLPVNLACETSVPLGSQVRLVLPDSSTVVLNSGSVLKYSAAFGKKERSVYLSGEGYFEVKKDKKRAFHVFAGETEIEVTGTVFNVCAYPENELTEVDLIEGGVRVKAGKKHVMLKPNERAVYNKKSGSLVCANYETYKAALWTTGKLSFVNASFLDILKDIERKYNVKIRVESKKIRHETFSGTINLNMTLQEVLNFIDVDKKYVFESSGGMIVMRDR